MPHLSVRITNHLHEQLIAKGRQMGFDNVSDPVRMLLLWALENQALDPCHQTASYTSKLHCLVNGVTHIGIEAPPEVRVVRDEIKDKESGHKHD